MNWLDKFHMSVMKFKVLCLVIIAIIISVIFANICYSNAKQTKSDSDKIQEIAESYLNNYKSLTNYHYDFEVQDLHDN